MFRILLVQYVAILSLATRIVSTILKLLRVSCLLRIVLICLIVSSLLFLKCVLYFERGAKLHFY